MRLKVSVAMAVYNGEKFLRDQLDSILNQLQEEDEIVVSLDPSEDNTSYILREYHRKDSRVKVCYGRGQGVVKNFENAILHCKNDIVFLSDQDDVWIEGKVNKVLAEFSDEKIICVLHDSYIVDKELNILQPSFFKVRRCRTGIIKNVIRNSYIGCCMAFRRKYIKKILPFPEKIPMHDQWIGLCCEYYGKVKVLPIPLVKYRRHDSNVSELKHASLIQMIIWRICLIFNLCKLLMRKLK